MAAVLRMIIAMKVLTLKMLNMKMLKLFILVLLSSCASNNKQHDKVQQARETQKNLDLSIYKGMKISELKSRGFELVNCTGHPSNPVACEISHQTFYSQRLHTSGGIHTRNKIYFTEGKVSHWETLNSRH